MHWHGIRHLNNNINDGVGGVTECPIPPKGGRKTYSFLATQYGTSWYHSHYSSQYANGVTGSIVINGPASLPYDIDLGPFPISDWYYGSADNLFLRVNDPTNPFIPGAPGSPPPSDNVFFNGTNVNPTGNGGSYAKVVLMPGKRHLLRLVNPSVDNTFTVSIVGHSMTVIANDFVPVNAFTTHQLFMGVGERYDVTIDASRPVDNYWINVTFSGAGVCGSSRNTRPAAILSYAGADDKNPTDPGVVPPDSLCGDQDGLTPVVQRTVPKEKFTGAPGQSLAVVQSVDASASKVFWQINNKSIDVIWEHPTLELIAQGNDSLPESQNIIKIPESSEVCHILTQCCSGQRELTMRQWSFWLVQNLSPIPHPMHLHVSLAGRRTWCGQRSNMHPGSRLRYPWAVTTIRKPPESIVETGLV